MNRDVADKLRAPFPADVVGKLPRVWCGACRNAPYKVCAEHRKARCKDCRNNITDAHLHLDYVGHAETTDRLLSVDPNWTWEPMAFGQDGLPVIDHNGGLWIRLTVADVTRIGYGHAEGKKGPDAVKETIGDAIRNASMRFGVALDLWGATFKAEAEHSDQGEPQIPTPNHVASGPSARAVALFGAITTAPSSDALKTQYEEIGPALEAGDITPDEAKQLAGHVKSRKTELENAPEPMGDRRQARMFALFAEKGITDRDDQIATIAAAIGRTPKSRGGLTATEADLVIRGIESLPMQQGAAA